MKKQLCLFALMFITICLLADAPREISKIKRIPYAPDIVKVKLSSAAIQRTSLASGLYAESSKFELNELDQLMVHNGGQKIIRAHRQVKDLAWQSSTGFDRWFLIKLDGRSSVEEAIASFKANRYIEEAIPEYYAYTTAVPNDTYYANNWGHNNTAQFPAYSGGSHSGTLVGTVGFDVDAQLAWDQSQGYGSASIIIAIIDTGVDTTHPDLRLVAGYDYGVGDSNPMDDSADPGHGTACSGVAAGRANNALGVTGIAGGCSVMPLKIANAAGDLSFTAIENALTHCGDNNVDVASMSFGAEDGMAEGSSPSTDAALEYAYSHGVTLLAATANANTSAIAYPSNHNKVISVGAASPTGQRKSDTSSDGEYWWGSNYGTAVQDAALAVDICAPTILPATDITGNGNGYNTSSDYYMWFNGTSCATPYAAGVAGLILSKDPTLTPAQVRAAMTSTATDMTLDGGVGWDRFTGYGMVNANAALNSLVPGLPTCSISSPASGSTFDVNSTITVEVTATDTDGTISNVKFYVDGSATAAYTDSSAPYSWAWNTTGLSAGTHTVKAIATDNSFNTSQSEILVNLLAPADEGFESGNFNAFNWTNSSAIPWTVQSTEKYSGTYAAKSGAIGGNANSSLSLSLYITSAGNISFFQKVSSESGFDFLKFYVDDVEKGSWSGTGSWASQSYAVTAGSRTFRWTYSKDGSAVGGSDCAWLDHISFPPNVASIPPSITWNPASITKSLLPNATTSQALLIGNTGNQTLNYACSLPSSTSTVLNEGFENAGNIPTGWTQENVSGTAVAWVFAAGGYNSQPASAYEGSYNARLYKNSSIATVTRLYTPALNLSTASSASLTFWHTQALWSSDQDQLRVYYRTSAAGAWTLLSTYTNSITAWTMETINLPNLSGTYYIGFEGTAKYGYGVCLDNVAVTAQLGAVSPWLSINGDTTVSGSIAYEEANQSINVGFNSTGLSAGTYNSTITLTSNSVSNSSVSIPVTLTVTAPTPQINVSVASLAFGTQLINTTQSSSFQISNAGTATLSGSISTPAGYSVALSSSGVSAKQSILQMQSRPAELSRNSLSYTVNAGSSNTYSVSFAPTAVQAYNGSISITHNAGGANKTIALTGQGGKPTLGLSASTFNNSLAPNGSSSSTLTISNSGNMPLNYAVNVSGTPGWLKINGGNSVSSSIAVGAGAHSISIGFNAAGMSPGTYNASLNGTSNDPANLSYSIAVSLTVTEPIAISSPVGGESWDVGSLHAITWNYSGIQNSLKLWYSTNNGANWIDAGNISTISGVNSYNWLIPNAPSTTVKLKLMELVAPQVSSISNTFQIVDPAPPGIAQNLQISYLDGNVTISWDPSTGNPTGYYIYRSSGVDFAPADTELIGTNAAAVRSLTVTASGAKAFYRVVAYRN